jgi:hypothetical protein
MSNRGPLTCDFSLVSSDALLVFRMIMSNRAWVGPTRECGCCDGLWRQLPRATHCFPAHTISDGGITTQRNR